MCSYLIYSSFILNGMVWAVTLVINLGASGSKAQMVIPCGTVSTMDLVTALITQCYWRSLALLGFSSLPWILLSQACSGLGCQLRPVSVNVHGLHLLLQRTLDRGWSCKGLWLLSTPSDIPYLGVPGPTEDLAQAYSLRGLRLTAISAGDLGHVYSLEGPRFMPRSAMVSDSGPLAQWLLPCTCSCGVCCLSSVQCQVAGSVLPLQIFLVKINSSSKAGTP